MEKNFERSRTSKGEELLKKKNFYRRNDSKREELRRDMNFALYLQIVFRTFELLDSFFSTFPPFLSTFRPYSLIPKEKRWKKNPRTFFFSLTLNLSTDVSKKNKIFISFDEKQKEFVSFNRITSEVNKRQNTCQEFQCSSDLPFHFSKGSFKRTPCFWAVWYTHCHIPTTVVWDWLCVTCPKTCFN